MCFCCREAGDEETITFLRLPGSFGMTFRAVGKASFYPNSCSRARARRSPNQVRSKRLTGNTLTREYFATTSALGKEG